MHKVHPLACDGEPAGFALTHCMKCEAGWTRRGKDGAKVIICLLDREPVWSNMIDCDRYEPREQQLPHHPSLVPKQKAR